jgi:hypothetical protein
MTVIMKMRMKGKTRAITVPNQLRKLKMAKIIKAKIKCSRQGVVVVMIMIRGEEKIKITRKMEVVVVVVVVVAKRGMLREIMTARVIGAILIKIEREGRINQTHTQEQQRSNQLLDLVLKIIEQQEEPANHNNPCNCSI